MAAQKTTVRRKVTLSGRTPILFDRYGGDNKTALPVEQKYYTTDGGRVILPATNLVSFLSAENTRSAPKRNYDSRRYKEVCQAALAYVSVSPSKIPFTRNGKPLVFKGEFDGETFFIRHDVARLDKGIPNPKERPGIEVPWELSFTLDIFQNDELNDTELRNLFAKGGMNVGLGTFRPVFGKFEVTQWE